MSVGNDNSSTEPVAGAYSLVLNRRNRLAREGKSSVAPTARGTGKDVRQKHPDSSDEIPRTRPPMPSEVEIDESLFPSEPPDDLTIEEAALAALELLDADNA